MAADHSSLTGGSGWATRKVTLTTAAQSELFTPPAWARECSMYSSGGYLRVSETGTAGSALSHYIEIPSGTPGIPIPLSPISDNKGPGTFYVEPENSSQVMSIIYSSGV